MLNHRSKLLFILLLSIVAVLNGGYIFNHIKPAILGICILLSGISLFIWSIVGLLRKEE